jgi:CMP-N,N'-diacetyllegionaminic acid synthase
VKVVALVTARGGSKGLPRKNILSVAGKPLIAWSIEAALLSTGINRVIVSTDDEEIASVAKSWGAEVPYMRPAALAQDHSDHLSVILHALDWLDADQSTPHYLFLLQPTSPLRTADDLDSALEIGRKLDADAVIGVTSMKHHPYLAQRIDENGVLASFMPTDNPYLMRQSLPPAYAINGAVYLNKPESIRQTKTLFPRLSYPYIMPAERSIDIDTEMDMRIAELLLLSQLRK